MATPSIQVLITQAQQVLNLQSSNEIRATLAAVLANANVGTPLNPNLTTQQLWDEFDEIVRQSTDDILSIIVDQMMRFVYAPPAPGGAGADKQVIFNDMGVLAGDAGLVYNKTTDALTVAGLVTAGSATISGNLTVDTSTLVVNPSGYADRVGIGTATPAVDLHIQATGSASAEVRLASATRSYNIGSTGSGYGSANNLIIYDITGAAERYRLDANGNHFWNNVGGIAGTRMTLNSTGLGIGDAPAAALHAKKTLTGTASAVTNILRLDSGGSGNTAKITLTDGVTSEGYLTMTGGAVIDQILGLGINGVNQLVLNSSGNVGIGATPSAWGGSNRSAIQFPGGNAIQGSGSLGLVSFCNSYNNGTNDIYIANGIAYKHIIGPGFQWFTSPSGTAGNAITFTQAMTLDASGVLAIGTVALGFTSSKSSYFTPVAGYWIGNHTTGTASGERYWGFGYGVNEIGSITQNGTTGVLYNIVSDYRLKKSVVPISGGLARVNALKPSVYNWKSDGSTGEGFLAHELAEAVPFAVTGKKDAMNADGTIKPQGIDMSRVVPILVAAIQELTARVQTLEAK